MLPGNRTKVLPSPPQALHLLAVQIAQSSTAAIVTCSMNSVIHTASDDSCCGGLGMRLDLCILYVLHKEHPLSEHVAR